MKTKSQIYRDVEIEVENKEGFLDIYKADLEIAIYNDHKWGADVDGGRVMTRTFIEDVSVSDVFKYDPNEDDQWVEVLDKEETIKVKYHFCDKAHEMLFEI